VLNEMMGAMVNAGMLIETTLLRRKRTGMASPGDAVVL
jgi:hypothetical protein